MWAGPPDAIAVVERQAGYISPARLRDAVLADLGTAPAEIALVGIADQAAVFGSCAKVTPPSALMAFSPSVPSDPLPERITPMAAVFRSRARAA